MKDPKEVALSNFHEGVQRCENKEDASKFCQMICTLAIKMLNGIEGEAFKNGFLTSAVADKDSSTIHKVIIHQYKRLLANTEHHLTANNLYQGALTPGTGIDYDLLADKITTRLKPTNATENQLWDSQTCADYLQITRQHFTDHVSKRPGFPAPSGPAAENKAYKRRRWHKHDIIKWLNPDA